MTSTGCVGLHGERAPDFLGHVGLEAFFEQFREVDEIARGGEDGVEHDLSSGAMVRVVDAVDSK